MILFPVIMFVVELVFSNGAVIPDTKINTFYNAVENKCPLVKEFPDFKNQKIFDKCTDWTNINEMQSLTEDTENNFLCLLYYESLNMFCSEITQVLPEHRPANISLYFTPTLAEYKVEAICKNLSLFPPGKKFGHNITQWLKTDIQCFKICSTFVGTPETECSLAYYFANMNVTMTVPKKPVVEPETGKSEVPLNKTPGETSGETHELIVADPNVKLEKENQNQQLDAHPEKVPSVVPGVVSQDTLNPPSSDAGKAANALPNSPPLAEQTPEEGKSSAQNAVKPNVELPIDQQSSITKGSNGQTEVSNDKGEKTVADKKTDDVSANKGVVEEDTVNHHPEASLDGNGADTEMEIESPSMQQIEQDLENPDDSPPLEVDDDDEEQQYKKEEQEAYKEEKESAKEKLNADNEIPKGDTQDKKEGVPNEDEKDTKAVVLMPDNVPISSGNATDIDGESYFFSYFMAICVLFVLGYVGYHNRQKVMALMVEGKRGKRQYRGRRPNSANYHKLDSNLEEAISSSCTKNSSHVIY